METLFHAFKQLGGVVSVKWRKTPKQLAGHFCGSAYNYALINAVWCTRMEQFAMNHTLNELQITFMQLNPGVHTLPWERSKQIGVLYFHQVSKSRMSHLILLFFFLKQSCLHAAQRSQLWRSSDEWLKTIIAIIRYSTYLNYSFHSASAGDAVQRPSVGFPIRIINLQKTSSRISINCDVLVLPKTVSVPAAYLNFKRIAHYFDISILIRL